MKKNVYTHQFTGVVYVVLKTIEDAEVFSKRSIEIDGIHISRNQLLYLLFCLVYCRTSYINGNAENNVLILLIFLFYRRDLNISQVVCIS